MCETKRRRGKGLVGDEETVSERGKMRRTLHVRSRPSTDGRSGGIAFTSLHPHSNGLHVRPRSDGDRVGR